MTTTRWWKNFEDNICLFVSTESTNVTDRQTDEQTDGRILHDGIGRACIVSRTKNRDSRLIPDFGNDHCWITSDQFWTVQYDSLYSTWAASADRVGYVNKCHWCVAVPRVSESCLPHKPTTLCRRQIVQTSSSAVAKRPRDASCLSVVSFNSTKRRVGPRVF